MQFLWAPLDLLLLVSPCAVTFHYTALFPKGNKAKTFIRGLYCTFNKCSPQRSKLPTCWVECEDLIDETSNGLKGIRAETVCKESHPYLCL